MKFLSKFLGTKFYRYPEKINQKQSFSFFITKLNIEEIKKIYKKKFLFVASFFSKKEIFLEKKDKLKFPFLFFKEKKLCFVIFLNLFL